MTPSKRTMWMLLRDRRFRGLKFRRQERIERWIVDFCCYDLKLVVELDGRVHRLGRRRTPRGMTICDGAVSPC